MMQPGGTADVATQCTPADDATWWKPADVATQCTPADDATWWKPADVATQCTPADDATWWNGRCCNPVYTGR